MDTKIHGFYANVEMLEQEDVFRRLFCGLSRERQQKIEQIKPRMERARSLMAGALMDVGLLRLYGLRERDEAISYGPQGKPFLLDHPGIHFNLSHSGDYALAAFAPAAVGCDIQRREQAKNSERIAARFFSEEEQRALEQGVDFYRIWARKESFLKLTGAGMALDMRSFCVTGEMCVIDAASLTREACAALSGMEQEFSYAGSVDMEQGIRQVKDADMEQGIRQAKHADMAQEVRQGISHSVRCAGNAKRSQEAGTGSFQSMCRFTDFELPDYCLALCYASAELFSVEWEEIKLEEFLKMYSAE